MEPSILTVLFWAFFAVVIACVEIEIEGKHGWAEKLPTWYRTTGFWAVVYGRLMGGKPLTGYHLFMFLFPVLLFHAPFFMGLDWTAARELAAWAMYFAWCPLWDYCWFVLNPHYKGKFGREHVWWHARSRWLFNGLFPADYAIAFAASFGFAALASAADGSRKIVQGHFGLLIGFALTTAILKLAAPAYHRWYFRMRERDDRGEAGIFHDSSKPVDRDEARS